MYMELHQWLTANTTPGAELGCAWRALLRELKPEYCEALSREGARGVTFTLQCSCRGICSGDHAEHAYDDTQ